MKNGKLLMAILAIALVLGMTACGNGGGGGSSNSGNDLGGISGGATSGITAGSGGTDSNINGIWFSSSYTYKGVTYNVVVKLSSGNWEMGYKEGSLYYPYAKGTYVTSNSTFTYTQTHVHGAGVNWEYKRKLLDSKWYLPSELIGKTLEGYTITAEDVYWEFMSGTGVPYTVNSNTLTTQGEIFTKQ
jgi:hypothetical protein